MILGGVILLIAGAVIALLTFLNSTYIFSQMGDLGFGGWIARFFDPQYLTGKKIIFYIAVLAMIVGVVMWIIGRIRTKKGNYQDEKAQKAVKYFRGLFSEVGKVVWPTGKTVVRNTIVTIAMCAVVGALIVVFDIGLTLLIDLLLSL